MKNQNLKPKQKFKVNVGKWESGSINSKAAHWAQTKGYTFYIDRRKYIHVKIDSNYYVINDIFQNYKGELIIEFISRKEVM